ncbi:MAG: hypothetical protein WCA37_01725 [Terracidiphilus sp.]
MYFIVGEKTQIRCSVIIFSCCAALLWSAHAISAQEIQSTGPVPAVPHVRVATNTSTSALDGSATARKDPASTQGRRMKQSPSPSDQAAQSAAVAFRDGKLTVEANNSDLAQILRDLANISGMTINGLGKGPRVFGVYGPGNSRDVLTALLLGSGYNFIMVGGAVDGTPRALLLTAENNDAPTIARATPTEVPSSDPNERVQQQLENDPSAPNALGPGAVAPVPSLEEQDDNTRAQSALQRLQHIQDQQKQNAPQ